MRSDGLRWDSGVIRNSVFLDFQQIPQKLRYLIVTAHEKIEPAWICSQCGEVFFAENEVNHIQNALEKIDHETQALRTNIA
jgi:predicted oxidoreductase